MIDLLIVSFACLSLVVFATTKDKETNKETTKSEQTEESENKEK